MRGGLGRLEDDVLDILRVGAYQLLELDRVPPYAAVSDAVEAARRSAGEGAGRLTNAVLRRLGRSSASEPERGSDPLAYLSGWGSHPAWLIERWLARWPAEEVERLVEHNNRRPSVYLRVLGNQASALECLQAAAIDARAVHAAPGLGEHSIQVDSSQIAEALRLVDAIVQDPAASAVVDYMALDAGVRIVDFCAAPGGKATLLSALGHEVSAFDSSWSRLALLTESRERLGLERLHLAVADAAAPPVASVEAALLDVPCTGTGTLARHPEAKWRLDLDGLEELASLQRRLLDGVAAIVRPGGWLVYATCSLEPEENEEQVARFLDRHGEFRLDPPPEDSLPAEHLRRDDGALSLMPQRHGVDGAYAARLLRVSG